ncbi:hypothetical protein, partial [Longibacter sp.]|uniref:hypothetical protein n=1 Tax=Longibacter sp. TaxID=2045415 RepID=UPI003EBECF4C
MQRLAGGFQVLMERTAVSKRAGASPLPLILQKTAIRDEVGVVRYPAIIRTSDPEALQRAGIPVNSVMGSIVTARLTAEEIRTAAGIASIRRIQPAAIASLHNDEAAREVGARILNSGAVNGTSYSGQGVL